jgi:hypothetical protein
VLLTIKKSAIIETGDRINIHGEYEVRFWAKELGVRPSPPNTQRVNDRPSFRHRLSRSGRNIVRSELPCRTLLTRRGTSPRKCSSDKRDNHRFQSGYWVAGNRSFGHRCTPSGYRHASVSNNPRSTPVLCNNGLCFCDDTLGVTLEKSCDGRCRKLGLCRQNFH